ncbi:hypothetical protein ABZ756_13670 [Mammaliicoccus sciuri]
MDIDAIIAHKIKTFIKKPKQVGSVVFVHNGAGELVETHKTIDLGKAFFTMSNDAFFDKFGFNFVPEGTYWERSKRASGKL